MQEPRGSSTTFQGGQGQAMLFQARGDGGVSVAGSCEVGNSRGAYPTAFSPQMETNELGATASCGTVTDASGPEDSFESQGQVLSNTRNPYSDVVASRSDFSTEALERKERKNGAKGYRNGLATSEGGLPEEAFKLHGPNKLDAINNHDSSLLTSLLPRSANQPQDRRLGQAASDPVALHPWSSSDLDREVVQSSGRLTKRRRPIKRAELNLKDDTDYEPGVRNYRYRKQSGAARQKVPGRARLTLAGVASTVGTPFIESALHSRKTGDVDPGWKAPHGSVVLVAKTLTKSDTLGRVILPRVAVETNMSFLTAYRAYSLAVRDMENRPWEFVVKSWANGSEQRRVYVLEQASLFLRTNHLHEGDIMGICCDEEGNLRVAANTPQLQEAVARPTYGASFVKPATKVATRKASPAEARTLNYRTPFAAGQVAQASSLGLPGAAQAYEDSGDFVAAAERPVRAASQLRSKRSSGLLDSRFAPGKATSLPLTDDEIAHGRSRMPLTLKQDPATWLSSTISAKDDLGETWTLSLQPLDRQNIVLICNLEDFYKQQAARAGDCVEVISHADGSKQLQLEPCQDTRPRLPHGRPATLLQDRKRRTSSASLDKNLLAIQCGELAGHLDLSEGSVLTSSDLSSAMSFSMSDFQAQAGFEASDDWMQTVHVCSGPCSTTLEQWLYDNGLQPNQLKQLCCGFESKASALPPSRVQKNWATWPRSGKRSAAAVRGGWVGRKLSDGSVASYEDSIAAEVLMSLSERDYSPEVSEVKMAFQRARSGQLDSQCRSAAESAARMAESEATLAVQQAAICE